jgi:hypothetical protein
LFVKLLRRSEDSANEASSPLFAQTESTLYLKKSEKKKRSGEMVLLLNLKSVFMIAPRHQDAPIWKWINSKISSFCLPPLFAIIALCRTSSQATRFIISGRLIPFSLGLAGGGDGKAGTRATLSFQSSTGRDVSTRSMWRWCMEMMNTKSCGMRSKSAERGAGRRGGRG